MSLAVYMTFIRINLSTITQEYTLGGWEECREYIIYGYCFNVLCKLEYVSSSSNINPNPGGIANMTSKYQNGCVKFIIHAKNVKKIVILHKSLLFYFEKASFLSK